MKSKELMKLLKQNGWVLKDTTGSHFVFKKEGVIHNITVPFHGSKDLAKGLLHAILIDAGLK